MRILLGVLLLVMAPAVASAQGLVSLDTLTGFGDVVVTSAHDELSDATIRDRVVDRLTKQGLFVEGEPHPARVLVDVTVNRETSNQQPCSYLVYEVRLSVEEVAVLERSPEKPFYATTWSRSSQLSGFVRQLPAQAVLDHVENLLSDLIRSVQGARGKAKQRESSDRVPPPAHG